MDQQSKLIAAGGLAAGLAATMWWLDSSYIISSDLSFIFKYLSVKKAIDNHVNNKDTFVEVWQATVAKSPKKSFILYDDHSYSYRSIDKLANKIANWGIGVGLKPGDTAALFMQNRPEYVAVWIGLLKIGCSVALINYNIKGKPLVHSLSISGAKKVIVGTRVIEAVLKVSQELVNEGFHFYAYHQPTPDRKPLNKNIKLSSSNYTLPEGLVGWDSFDEQLLKYEPNKVSRKLRSELDFFSKALLVYTSGTTGLPKAAVIKHVRLFSMGIGFKTIFGISENDRIYCVLPLYHSAGGLCGVGMTVCSGGTMVLRDKFSAKNFWHDCRRYKATAVQYIGELCRYLLAVPPDKKDAKNSVRIAMGNGLRPEIWPDFQKRFGIPEIGEFYGSTEGNISLFNHCTTPEAQGAVGRTGKLLMKIMKMRLVKFDVENETIIRGSDGWAIDCQAGEPGELLGLVDNTNPLSKFDGYHGNKKATQKKIATDVFTKGDMYFRTGDLLMRDAKGYWHFVDRIGDTFRWKGENVSTNEVSQVVSVYPGVDEVNIYGVAIPGRDGRACMGAMVVKDDLSWEGLAKHCQDNLPGYSVPLFIRILPKIVVTGTFKHQKVKLRNEGADPSKVKDTIMFLDGKTYSKLDQDAWQKIVVGKAKL